MKSLIIGLILANGVPLSALSSSPIYNVQYVNTPLNKEYQLDTVIDVGAYLHPSNYGYHLELINNDTSDVRYNYKLPIEFDKTKNYVFNCYGYFENRGTTIFEIYKNGSMVYDGDITSDSGGLIPTRTFVSCKNLKSLIYNDLVCWTITEYQPLNNIVTIDNNEFYLDIWLSEAFASSGSEYTYYNIVIIDIIEYNNYSETFGEGYNNGYEQGKQDGATSNYLDGYDAGLQDGLRSQQGKIDSLNSLIQDLQNQLRELQQSSMTPLADLIFSIADLPLRFFAQCFNFNFLGFNLSYVLFGALTILFIGFIINKLRNKE